MRESRHNLGSTVLCRLTLALAVVAILPPRLAAQCAGDCNGDGSVSISELIRGVNLALGAGVLADCAAADFNGDGVVRITDLIASVNSALSGCPATPTPTSSPLATATATVTATSTATATPNLPPLVEAPLVYRSFPGMLIEYPVSAMDPEGGAVTCEAGGLPAGAALDPETRLFSWTPGDGDVGAYAVGLTCSDPEGTAGEAALPLRIAPLDACTMASCDPASGCETAPLPIDQDCCDGEPEIRIPEPDAPCPAGRLLRVGRNERGFGRIGNCNFLRMFTFNQGGSHVFLSLETRCLNVAGMRRLSARMETDTRVLFDRDIFVELVERGDGFAQERGILFMMGIADPRLIEGEEALISLRLTDADGIVVEHSLRVVLTTGTLPDLAELD